MRRHRKGEQRQKRSHRPVEGHISVAFDDGEHHAEGAVTEEIVGTHFDPSHAFIGDGNFAHLPGGRPRRTSARGLAIRKEQDESLISLRASPRSHESVPPIPALKRLQVLPGRLRESPTAFLQRGKLDPVLGRTMIGETDLSVEAGESWQSVKGAAGKRVVSEASMEEGDGERDRNSGSFSARGPHSTSELRERELRGIIAKLKERISDLETEVNVRDRQVAELRNVKYLYLVNAFSSFLSDTRTHTLVFCAL